MSPRHRKNFFYKKPIPQVDLLQEEEQKNVEVKSAELPHLPAYDKTVFRSFYLPDFLADIVLIIFSFFVNDQLFSKGGIFIHLQTWQISAMYCVVVLTIPWYLGYLYVRDSVFYNKVVMKIFLWVFILMTLMMLIQLMRLALSEELKENYFSGITGFTAVFATFLLVLGPMMCIGGAMQANNEFTSKETDPQKFDAEKLAGGPGAFFILIMAVGFMLYIIGLFSPESKLGFLVILLAMFGGPFLAVVVFGIFLAFLKLLDKIGIYKYLKILAVNTFPFFIICVLVFWSGVAIYFMHADFGNASGKISKGAMLFIVIVSGLVPFRIIMLFNAPLRLSNMIMGGISLSYFFWQMFSITY